MWERERKYKEEIATYHDKQRHTKEIVLEVGDQVLRPQTKPPFNPEPLTVVKHHSTQSLSQ